MPPLPPEIANNLPAVVDFARTSFVDGLEGTVGSALSLGIRRALSSFIPAFGPPSVEDVARRVERLEAAKEGFDRRLTSLESELDGACPQDAGLDEPSTQDFIVEALVAVVESPSAEKRDVLGQLIADRLYAGTESSDELYLREALSITRRVNAKHLSILATVSLVQNPPRPDRRMTRQEINDWLDETADPLLVRASAVGATYSDLTYLVSIAALIYTEQHSISYQQFSSEFLQSPTIEQMIIEETGEHYLSVPGDQQRRAGFYNRSANLYRGTSSQHSGEEVISLAPYTLTLAGNIVAETALDGIARS